MAGFIKKILTDKQSAVAAALKSRKNESRINCGDPSLNWCVGGWSHGRMNLIYGPKGSGKSAIAVVGAAECQRKSGGYVIIFDSEYYYLNRPERVTRLEKFGLDAEKTIVISSNQMDVLFANLSDLMEDAISGDMKVCAVIVDSWGGIQSDRAESKISGHTAKNKSVKKEISSAGDQYGNAKYMNPVLGYLLRMCAENDVTGFAVQHCIQNLDDYGGPWKMLGGERLRFLVDTTVLVESASAAIVAGDIDAPKMYDPSAVRVGKLIRAKCEKSRLVVEGRKAEFFMNFDECRFARKEESLFTLASNLGVIGHPMNEKGKVNNAMWEYPAGMGSAIKAHGQDKMIELLKDDILFTKIYNDCMENKNTDAARGYNFTPVKKETESEKDE